MHELETQVVKIQLGDAKQATSYVYTLAEKVDANDSELYMICELPLFNPAAAPECERIAEAVAGSLKRSYRKTVTPQTFENALATINEELGKLVSLGKTHWIGKLNAVIAVKHGINLYVASAGKISAHLYRDNHFTSIAESANATPHPLKTFENFSEGKMRLNDVLVLSTTQLFNHVSVDRFKNILRENSLSEAARDIINTLQDAMGPEVACGTIFALQVEPGTAVEDDVELQSLAAGPQIYSETSDENWLDKLKKVRGTATAVGKTMAGDVKERFKSRAKIADVIRNRQNPINVVQDQFKRAAKQFQPEAIKGYSRQKKFFMISAAVLLIALIANVAIAKYFQSSKKAEETTTAAIETMQKIASDANAAFLYGDEAKAASLLSELQNELSKLEEIPEDKKEAIDQLRIQADDLQAKVTKVSKVGTETLGTLGNSDHLIVLPGYFATEINRSVVSYNRSSGQVQDNALRSSEPIIRSAFWEDDKAVIYNGRELLLWDTSNGVIGGAFSEQVPSSDGTAGLRVYPTNDRVYLVDKAKSQVTSFGITGTEFNQPRPSVTNASELANAADLAIDGNIYIVSGGNITKYNSGAKQEFNSAVTGLSDKTKLYTQVDYTNLYVMDPAKKTISILGKDGSLVKTLTADSLNDMRDFYVDEKAKTIYVLNNGSLLSVKF